MSFLFKGCYEDIPEELTIKELELISTIKKNNILGLFIELEY